MWDFTFTGSRLSKAANATSIVPSFRLYELSKSRPFFLLRTKPVFHKKAKTTRKPHLRNKCVECNFVILSVLKCCKSFELIGNHQRQRGSKKDVVFGKWTTPTRFTTQNFSRPYTSPFFLICRLDELYRRATITCGPLFSAIRVKIFSSKF